LVAGRIGRIADALNARPNATNVEATEVWLAQVEAIGNADIVDPNATALLQRMDVTTLGIERPDETRTNVEEFRSFNLRANIFHIAAKPCEI
ncbi:hypothetical protein ACXYUI_27795, partial [Klebsiella pneumoniae]